MTATDKCPSQQVIQELVNGTLSAAETDSLGQHLLECEQCSKSAETLFPVNEITTVFNRKEPPNQSPEDEAAISRLITQAKGLKPSASQSGNQPAQAVSANDESVHDNTLITSSDSPLTSSDETGFLAPAEEQDEIGRLGGYRVLQVLGSGGMGVVFRAEDPQLKRSVALKAMKPAIAANPEAKARFLREAQATAAIEHDHIVHIYQVGEDQNVPFIAMQFLQGESLQQRIDREGQLDQTEVLRIGREIAQGLAAAHAQGLTHRDIKPDNIWLQEEQGRVKIVDFGLVRNSDDDAGLTQTGVIMGTPRYMAPEQAQGEAVDHRGDLFSLGSVLYQLASGKPAFLGKNLTATLIAVAHETPEPVEELNPTLDPALATLIMRLLEKDPDQRPQTAREVVQEFEEIETRQLAEGLPQAVPLGETVLFKPETADGQSGTGSSKRLRQVLGGLAGAILLGVLIFKFATRDGTVVVELKGAPDISSVEIDNRQVSFSPADKNKRLTFQVDPGSHRLSITTADGLELITSLGSELLEIKAGGHATLRAWVDPGTAEHTNSQNRDSHDESITFAPELSRWLKGRRIITVKQDGSADFTTITQAVASVKSGEVVEILDKGPYTEPVYILSPPPDSGIISRCGTELAPNTVIDQDRLEPPNIRDRKFKIRLDQCQGFRLAGLNFRLTSEDCDLLISGWNTAGVVVEDCSFRAEKASDEKPILFWLAPRVVTGQSIILRRNSFHNTPVQVKLQSPDARLTIERNFFHNEQTKTTLEIEGKGAVQSSILVRENVFVALATPAQGFSVTCEWADSSKQSTLIEHNTFFVPRGDAVAFREDVLTNGVTFRRNLCHTRFGIHLLPQGVSATREQSKEYLDQWAVDQNYYSTIPTADNLPAGQNDIVGGAKLLSTDPNQYLQFMRSAEDSRLVSAGSDQTPANYIGALPPGPAPKEGDWLTRLLVRQNGNHPGENDTGQTIVEQAEQNAAEWDLLPDAPSPAIAPFTAEQAKKHQEEWAKYFGVQMEREIDLGNGVNLTMVLIPPGEFIMGTGAVELSSLLEEARVSGDHWAVSWMPSEVPQHRVRITLPFFLGKYEVTQAQWQALMATNPSRFNDNPLHPVEELSWEDIQPFLAKVNYVSSDSDLDFKLPTEAQWEYACRAGTTTPFNCGGQTATDLGTHGWYVSNSSERIHPVGELEENAFGLNDMNGNGWEWCSDWFAADYYRRSPLNDPMGPPVGTQRVYRGGGWRDPARQCRSAFRTARIPSSNDFKGFRLAASIRKTDSKNDVSTRWNLPKGAPSPAIAPFSDEQAKRHQEEWAQYLGIPVENENAIGMKFRLVPPGEFLMGTSEEDARAIFQSTASLERFKDPILTEVPQHQVVLTKPFCLAAHEVTRAQFREFVNDTGYRTDAEKLSKGMGFNPDTRKWEWAAEYIWNSDSVFPNGYSDECPVVNVSWNDATAFCRWLSEKDGVAYRLPTDAEWEYAGRAGNEGHFCFGNDPSLLKKYAWYGGEHVAAHNHPMPVGELASNAWGFFDIHGNVLEWCSDKRRTYDESRVINPIGTGAFAEHVLRGGAFHLLEPELIRAAYRRPGKAEDRNFFSGFRIAIDGDAIKQLKAAAELKSSEAK